MNEGLMEKVVSLCKRRGFVYPSSEIYGGIGSCWDYGPLGVELKNNLRDCWWKAMTYCREDIVGLDASIMMHPEVWKASGHVDSFVDTMVDCKVCKARYKAEEANTGSCPKCGGGLTEARLFNLLFRTHIGSIEEESTLIYLRPETAQGIYVNFINVVNTSRKKVPFGIAQTGKAFRNEITVGNFIFRMKEFEQMEMQFFVKPETADKWFEEWKTARMSWYCSLGIDPARLRFREHGEDELAHYAKRACDVQYEFPFGWQEIEGVHNRTDFDLCRHSEHSGKDLKYFDETAGEKYFPYIIETSAGLDRILLACVVDAYREEPERIVMGFSPRIAPVKTGVYPLVKRDGMPEIARNIYLELRKHMKVFYDESGSIGRRYRRQDEAGTPFGITVDSQTLEDNTATLRSRDDMNQERIKIDRILDKMMKETVFSDEGLVKE